MNKHNPEIISIDSKSDVEFEDDLNNIIQGINVDSQQTDRIDYR